jgi:molybdate transport system substrate-binding protein
MTHEMSYQGLADGSVQSQGNLRPVVSRRSWLAAMPAIATLLAVPAHAAEPASGRASIPDVAVFCEPTLAPALRTVGTLFRRRHDAPVHVFSATPSGLLAMIERQTQTDLLISQRGWIDAGLGRGLVLGAGRVGSWRNQLVIAGRADETPVPLTELPNRLGTGHFAATDPTNAASFDAPSVLARVGLAQPLADRLVGAANTDDVAFLLTSGAARFGLLYITDVRADPRLVVVAGLPGSEPPILYDAAPAKNVASPNAMPFLDFLRGAEASAGLRAAGLEPIS